MEKTKRDIVIDIIRAIGIVLMVLYHASAPGKNFVYHFHMALFFIASGFCYSHKSELNICNYIKRKIKSLYFPCVISGIIIACLQNFFLDIHIYSYEVYSKLSFMDWIKQLVKCLGFGGGHQMIGANWFFRTLFMSSILYVLINKCLAVFLKKTMHKQILRFIICSCFTTLGGIVGRTVTYGKYFNFLTVMVLLDLGFLAKECQFFDRFKNKSFKLIVVLFSGIMLVLLYPLGNISINSNRIVNPLYFIACSVLGYLIVHCFARILSYTKVSARLAYIGRNSMWIMLFHYIGFKLVTLLEIMVLKEPIENLSAYPAHYTDHGMWFVYGIFGVGIPLLLVGIGRNLYSIGVKQFKSND